MSTYPANAFHLVRHGDEVRITFVDEHNHFDEHLGRATQLTHEVVAVIVMTPRTAAMLLDALVEQLPGAPRGPLPQE